MDKLNKMILVMILVIAILLAILSAIIIYKPTKQEQANEKIEAEVAKTEDKEEILDECTDEYEQIEQEKIIQTNTKQEKISPNCKITLTKHYKKCNDEINEYIKVPDSLVNSIQEDLIKYYKDWEVKSFSSTQIVLYKKFDGECGEHYVLRDENGKISIYKVFDDGKEVLYEKTDVSTDYLPDNDKMAIKEGLNVNGKEKLNEVIESFE